jgi:uncharacterized protein YigA (DUF484 family)
MINPPLGTTGVDLAASYPQAVPSGSSTALAEADVIGYLQANPDFLLRHPDLAGALALPPRDFGSPAVVDMQHALANRLRAEIEHLKAGQRLLVGNSRANAASQARVHAAVLALISATSFEHLVAVITDELTLLLDIDAVGLGVEREAEPGSVRLPGFVGGPSTAAGVQVLAVGAVDQILGLGQDVVLRPEVQGDPTLFGSAAAGLVCSDALVRLRVSSKAPIGLLALGSRKPGSFHPGQGTELLAFLARVIELTICAWLDLPE